MYHFFRHLSSMLKNHVEITCCRVDSHRFDSYHHHGCTKSGGTRHFVMFRPNTDGIPVHSDHVSRRRRADDGNDPHRRAPPRPEWRRAHKRDDESRMGVAVCEAESARNGKKIYFSRHALTSGRSTMGVKRISVVSLFSGVRVGLNDSTSISLIAPCRNGEFGQRARWRV